MNMGVRVRRGLVLAGLLLGVGFVGLPAGAAYAAPPAEAGASVNSIVVQGNRRVEADTVRSYFKVGPGEHLDAAKIDAGLKALYASGLFDDVHITQSGGHIIVTVVESPVINRLAFEGNHRMKDEQLQEEIQSKARDSLSRPRVQADTQRIIDVYHRNGRFDVTVVPQIIERPNNRVDLIFVVNEGEKTGVKSINFVGNKSYSSWRLKEVIKTSESNFLSFLQTTDVYDPDRMEADRDLIRRFYLKHGFADVQVVSAVAEYDPAKKGFLVTFTIEEGPLYHFGAADIQSNVRAIDSQSLRPVMRMRQGDIYNGEAIEKTVEDLTVEVARRGYPFATVRPRGDRNPQTRTINVSFVVDEGTRAYIERINIHGNIRTRDYVIRREFDIAEGDPYNRALIDRAERRLKNLNFFKSVKITNEPGSAPDRVVINVELEEQSTGDFSIMGGYSTAEGWLAQMSVSERNLLGTGRYAKVALTYGEYVRGAEFNFIEPYFLDQRLAAGIDLFAKETLSNSYLSYGTESYGGSFKLGIALREDLALQLRYSIYTQRITLPNYLDDCNNLNPDFVNTFASPQAIIAAGAAGVFYNDPTGTTCYTYGQASLPVRAELAAGTTLTSLAGYGLTYNTLDNNKSPTNGLLATFGQDFAGIGGDVAYMRSALDFHTYYEVIPDLIGILHLQGGNMIGLGGQEIRLLDDFKMGPNLVRGFAPAGLGPRDITQGTSNDAIGGTNYWGASLEFQYPFYFLPKDTGFRGAVFVDAGSVWGYKGETTYAATGEINGVINSTAGSFVCQCGMQFADSSFVRSSAGASIIWDSPFGPLRFDFAYPITKTGYDRTQFFAFGGGTHF
ncbi:MAG: outer membrane protein assembly factor BamA [Xanthobacteraceae bacterium]|jgi:outer membrane protein insertion porin family